MAVPAVLWFRRDLRTDDHPALLAAAADGREVLGLFVVDDALMKPSGAPRRRFLAATLAALNDALDGRLLIVHGQPATVVPRIASALSATEVHVSADYGPYGRRRDEQVAKALAARDIELHATGSPYAVAPGRVRKSDGSRYSVFTPYWHAWSEHGWRSPPVVRRSVAWVDPAACPASIGPRPRWSPPSPGRPCRTPVRPRRKAWRAFLDDDVDGYDRNRDRPDLDRTSRMSVYLKWGALHPRTLLHDLSSRRSKGVASYRRELAWREFYADILFHGPESRHRVGGPGHRRHGVEHRHRGR